MNIFRDKCRECGNVDLKSTTDALRLRVFVVSAFVGNIWFLEEKKVILYQALKIHEA